MPSSSTVARVLVASIVAAAAIGSAGAQAQAPAELTVALEPPTAAAGSTLVAVSDGSAPGIQGRVPRTVVLSAQRGFVLDPAAVASRCTGAQAQQGACPEGSRIGGGMATATVSGVFGAFVMPVTIDLHLAEPAAAGDLAGIVVTVSAGGQRGTSTGRVVPLADGPYGYEIRFEGLDNGLAPPAGVTVKVERLELRIGASRVVKQTVVRRKRVRFRDRRGHRRTRVVRRRVVVRTPHALITNPRRCATGSWAAHGAITFADGSTLERDVAIGCRPARPTAAR